MKNFKFKTSFWNNWHQNLVCLHSFFTSKS